MLLKYDSNDIARRVEGKTIDKHFILNVVNKTTSYYGKRMLRSEIEGLIHYIDEVDFNLMKNNKMLDIVDILAKNFTFQLQNRSGTSIDTHEVMKSQIGTITHDSNELLFTDKDCSPYGAATRLKDPSITTLRGQHGQNIEFKHERGLIRSECFGTRARNTDETNEPYIPSSDGLAVTECLSEQPLPLENIARPFSSLTDKYPRIAKQHLQNIYLLLDSKYRNLSTDNSTFKWTVLHSANTTQGTVNTLSDQIHNIVNVQFDRFQIPYTASADNVYRKISLFIEEFSSMSVLINSGRRYHMLFDSEIQSSQIRLTPLINDEGRFRFHTPINVLDTITIKFQSPFLPVEFLQDRYDVVVTSLNLTQSILTFSVPHQVVDGELVHLEGYNTLSPSADFVQIAETNREEGHIVTFINNLILRIEVNLSSVTADVNNLTNVFIASRRLIIPIRMEYMMI